jgi:hypothetical protein
MAWTAPSTWVAGNVLTAAQLNAQVRDNMLQTAPALASSALGQIFVATGTNALAARLIQQNRVDTAETTTSATFAALTTPGPLVTCTTGTQAIVIISVQGEVNATGQAYAGYAVSSATTIAAADTSAWAVTSSATGQPARNSLVEFVSLTAGSNVFTMQYRTSTGTATFRRRQITVIPL